MKPPEPPGAAPPTDPSPYRDAAQLRGLLEVVLSDEPLPGQAGGAAPAPADNPLVQRRLAVAYLFRNPDLTVLVDGRSGEGVQVSFGVPLDSAVLSSAPLSFSMSGETIHAFWLGELNMVAALTSGRLRMSGPLLQALAIAPLLPPLQARYRALWAARG